MKLIPQNPTFFDLLEASARRALDAARLLERLVKEEPGVWDKFVEMRAQGRTDEGITHQLIDKLNKTFVTPLDREDIHDLAFKLDAVTGAIVVAADRVSVYHTGRRETQAPALLALLVAACEEVCTGVGRMRKPKELKEALETARKIHRLGNDADLRLHAALEALFAEPVLTPADVLETIKTKEVYETLKKAIDRCEEVADLIHGVVVKNA
ncbi:MAG: phosphate transport regulator [Cyanobacteria bacterium RYN_339]|nr:phosphate transport regulator [Cyanobacteria bacterium RYN_339]